LDALAPFTSTGLAEQIVDLDERAAEPHHGLLGHIVVQAMAAATSELGTASGRSS
jgi:hypothetical protein